MCVSMCVCVFIFSCACFIYITETVYIMDFLFMLSAYAGCPELNRFSPSFLFPSITVRGHIVGVVNVLVYRCFALWNFLKKTYLNFFVECNICKLWDTINFVLPLVLIGGLSIFLRTYFINDKINTTLEEHACFCYKNSMRCKFYFFGGVLIFTSEFYFELVFRTILSLGKTLMCMWLPTQISMHTINTRTHRETHTTLFYTHGNVKLPINAWKSAC